MGEVWNVHGAYLQDWLLEPTDWNWRLEPDKGGSLRAVARHRLALARPGAVRHRPARGRGHGRPRDGDSGAAEADRRGRDVRGRGRGGPCRCGDDDAKTSRTCSLRFDDGARGSVVVSQVSAGRKNALSFEVDGSDGALAWDSERHEELWLGHRDRPNETLLRDPALFEPAAAARTGLPAGHAEGFADTFRELYRAVYAAVSEGGMPDQPDFPTFADGHHENVIADTVERSARERRWLTVPQ